MRCIKHLSRKLFAVIPLNGPGERRNPRAAVFYWRAAAMPGTGRFALIPIVQIIYGRRK
jgi:hypothetical protein